MKRGAVMTDYSYDDHKMVKITSKRQFTIPKKYYDALQIGEQARCYTDGGKLVIEPTHPDSFWDFSSDILKELVAENYSGEELLREFEKRKKNTAAALGKWSEDVKREAATEAGAKASDLFAELLNESDV